MVKIFIDKEFIRQFQKRTDRYSQPLVNDFYNQFIKKTRGVEIYVNLSSMSDLKESILTNEFYALLSEISTIKLKDFKNCLFNPSFYKEEPFMLFFIENMNEDLLQEKFNYLFISNASLAEKWKVFQTDREDNELSIKSETSDKDTGVFKSWRDLNTFSHPITSLLIFDLYILSNKKNQRLTNNIIPCINTLIRDNEKKVNEIVIITKELIDFAKKKKEVREFWTENDCKTTLNYLSSDCINKKIIHLIKYDKTRQIRGDEEHNRFILTNYFLIRTDSGFNIFKDKGKVNHRDSIRFDSILRNKTRRIVRDIIENISLYLENIEKTGKKGIGPGKILTHYFYYPDKTSIYFN